LRKIRLDFLRSIKKIGSRKQKKPELAGFNPELREKPKKGGWL